MISKPHRVMLAITGAFIASSSNAQTMVGPDSIPNGFNRLRDILVRPFTASPPARPDVFGTVAVGAGVTFYDARFRRVSQATSAAFRPSTHCEYAAGPMGSSASTPRDV